MSQLSAAPPLEASPGPVGWDTFTLHDAARDGRSIAVDVWYPAGPTDAPLVTYELLPEIAFESANAHRRAPMSGTDHPLVIVSHGRTGMRFNYTLLCEALAARGAIVVAGDHPGDGLFDWLGGTFVDDRTNEVNRVADTRFLLDCLLGDVPAAAVPVDVRQAIDPARIATVGHSYGAYTGLAAAGGARGTPPETRIKAVIGLQPYTRSMSDSALGRVHTPTLLVVSEFDVTAPASSDGERPWRLIPASPTWRLNLGASAHHASSDMGLYLELAQQMGDLPPMVAAYVAMMTAEMTGPHLRPWREGLVVQVQVIWAFLDIVLALDPARGEAQARLINALPDVELLRR